MKEYGKSLTMSAHRYCTLCVSITWEEWRSQTEMASLCWAACYVELHILTQPTENWPPRLSPQREQGSLLEGGIRHWRMSLRCALLNLPQSICLSYIPWKALHMNAQARSFVSGVELIKAYEAQKTRISAAIGGARFAIS